MSTEKAIVVTEPKEQFVPDFNKKEIEAIAAEVAKKKIEEIVPVIIKETTSIDYLKEHAVDLTDLPRNGEMVSPYKEIIEKAMKSQCVKFHDSYYFISYSADASWVGGYSKGEENADVLEISANENEYAIT